jgi:hypothetical protein
VVFQIRARDMTPPTLVAWYFNFNLTAISGSLSETALTPEQRPLQQILLGAKTISLLLYIFGRIVLLFAHSCFNKAYLSGPSFHVQALPATHSSIHSNNAFLRKFLPERR